MGIHIQDREWIDYLDGAGDPAQRSRLESHIRKCAQCRFVWDATGAAEKALAGAAAVGGGILVSEAELGRSLTRVLNRASLAGHEQLWTGAERERRLRRIANLMGPLCGVEGAQRMIEAAARRTGAAAGNELPAASWPEFARQFAALASRLCGETLGLLALERATA